MTTASATPSSARRRWSCCPSSALCPTVLHAHDWQSALTVVYLKYKYGLTPGYAEIKTVFTIHNIAYQGVYGFDILGDVFELTERESSVLDYSGSINLMKGAIVCADAVTTVSPTYAREILSPKFSGGLHHVLELHKGKLRGILNGIDTSYYDPANDPELFAAYSAEDPAGKAVNKAELQRMLSLPESPDTPLFAIVSRLADHKGLDLVALAADDILEGDVQLIVLGKGEYYYENFFYHLAQRYPNKVSALLVYNKDLSKKVYAGADMFLMPSKTEPLRPVADDRLALRRGADRAGNRRAVRFHPRLRLAGGGQRLHLRALQRVGTARRRPPCGKDVHRTARAVARAAAHRDDVRLHMEPLGFAVYRAVRRIELRKRNGENR